MAEQTDEQKRRTAAKAVAGGTLVVVGDVNDAAPGVPASADRATAAGKILSALVAFLTAQRARMRVWLTEQARKRAPSLAPDDIEKLIVEEESRQSSFERKQIQRFARDLTTALAIPDKALREGAVKALTDREGRYARQRSTAMAARALAAVDRLVLRQESPNGAFWHLDPLVVEHTAGCLIMGNKFWPWEVLDRIHPPRHPGCPCRLKSYGEAVANGLLIPGVLVDRRTAIRRAAAVVMEGIIEIPEQDAEALIEDAGGSAHVELTMLLLEKGLATEESLLEVETSA